MARIQGIASAHFQIDGILRLTHRLADEAARSKEVLRAVHDKQAEKLQKLVAQALIDAIDSPEGRHGPSRFQGDRTGKTAHPEETLIEAILDKSNRRVRLDGFTVGLLERGRARAYWRVQEFGYGGFVGMKIPGLFSDFAGRGRHPNGELEARIDPRFVQVKNESSFGKGKDLHLPVMTVHNPILGYHFQQKGWEQFDEQGNLGRAGVEIYKTAFADAGLDLLARYLKPGGRSFGSDAFSAAAPPNALEGFGPDSAPLGG